MPAPECTGPGFEAWRYRAAGKCVADFHRYGVDAAVGMLDAAVRIVLDGQSDTGARAQVVAYAQLAAKLQGGGKLALVVVKIPHLHFVVIRCHRPG